MNPLVESAPRAFDLTRSQVSALTLAEAFTLAAIVLVALIVLAAVAMLAGRWLRHSVDRVFGLLLFFALCGVIAWLYFSGYLYLP